MSQDALPGGWYEELSIEFPDGKRQTFFFNFTRSGRHVPEPRRDPAPWTNLEFHKCPGCPLTEAVCPAARSLESTLMKLHGHTSVEIVRATAIDSSERTVEVKWPLQQVASVFVQLAVFSGGCPIGDKMRPYVQDLRPFATTAEMTRHMVSKMLLKHRGAVDPSLKLIRDQMEPLHAIFTNLARRLTDQVTPDGDAIPNAIARLDAFAYLLAMQIDQICSQIGAELGWDAQAAVPPASQAPSERPIKGSLWQRLRSLFA